VKKSTKATIAAVVGLMLSGGVAAAATGTLPTQSDRGISTANDHAVVSVPASSDNPAASEQSDGNSDESSGDATAQDSSQPDNHGAAVSDVAQNTDATGADKGAAVSAVAQDNSGLNDNAATPGTVPDQAASQASDGASNADGHGRP
jgi:hypothetical protein